MSIRPDPQFLIRESLLESAGLTKGVVGHANRIIMMAGMVSACLHRGHKLILFGNGGSAADAEHWACELVGRFITERAGLGAIALSANTSTITSIANDYGYEQTFARQIEALGQEGDVACGLSTSGNSANVLHGIKQARQMGLHTMGLCGNSGGELAEMCDVALVIPSKSTPRIQECHIVAIHIICDLVERELSAKKAAKEN